MQLRSLLKHLEKNRDLILKVRSKHCSKIGRLRGTATKPHTVATQEGIAGDSYITFQAKMTL